jgi:hypothetical protein
MIDTVLIQPTAADEMSGAGVSWPAIFAGAVVSCALTLVLLTLGVALGATSVSPWSGSGVSATTFKVATGIYLIVIAMISSSLGGYIAGRLRTKWTGVHSDEVYFRDTAHGFITWAFASVLGALLLATPAASIMGSAASGAAQGAASNAGSMDSYLDTLLRSDTPSANANAGESRAELSRLFTSSFKSGSDMKPADKTYVAKVVAARTGISQADAESRVNQVLTEAKANLEAARKATAALAFWVTASLLLGAFCASLAATEGGGLRDGTWGNKARYSPTTAAR